MHRSVKPCTFLSKTRVASIPADTYSSLMHPDHLIDLRFRSPMIRERWEAFLRVEPVSNPLANPDALVHLIPETLNQILEALEKPSRAPVSIQAARAIVPDCDCGNNPYRAYFMAGEQALCETLVLLQAESPPDKRQQADLAELIFAVRKLAKTDIDTFCSACVHKGVAAKCRYHVCNERVAPMAV